MNNSKGIAATYTAILTPSLINSLVFGYTRQGLAYSGTTGDAFILYPHRPAAELQARARQRTDIACQEHRGHAHLDERQAHHHHRHQFPRHDEQQIHLLAVVPAIRVQRQCGGGIRRRYRHETSPTYMAAKTGNPNFALEQHVQRCVGAWESCLAWSTTTQVTYQVGKGGTLLPQGAPDVRAFSMREYEGFVSDQWRVSRELTLTLGLALHQRSAALRGERPAGGSQHRAESILRRSAIISDRLAFLPTPCPMRS